MARTVFKSLMFLSSIITMFFGCLIATAAHEHNAGIFGILLGIGIALAGLHSAFDLYRTFYVRQDK